MSTNTPWLTIVLLLPLAASVLLQLVPGRSTWLIKGLTTLATLAVAVLVTLLIVNLNTSARGLAPLNLHYEENVSWIGDPINARYHLGLDGLGAWMLALNAGVFLLGALVVTRQDAARLKFYCGLLLLTETATAGVILAADLLLFYLFWEAMLIPLYFLLSNFGGENRSRATLKFVIYTVAGSLLMLLAIIWLKTTSPQNSFDLAQLILHPGKPGDAITLWLIHITPQQFAFLAFVAAFAIKLPLVPFHTWLPDLYEAAPAPALVFFAGIVSKMGAFGFIRYAITLFPSPAHTFQWLLLALSVISIIYGALMALSEVDIKRIVAYASVSHLGFIGLGIFSLNQNGINGAILQIVNHGIIIAALFLVVGLIEAKTRTRSRHELAGLEKQMPYLYFFFLIITLAGLGMPGMNSFVGEFTIMLGAFQTWWLLAVLAGVGVVLACWYMLRLHQGLMHEPLQPKAESVGDISVREGWVLLPLAALMVFLGLYPKPIGDIAAPAATQYVAIANGNVSTTTTVVPAPFGAVK